MADKKVELLIPAGSLEVLKVGVDYGADAIYLGGRQFGLRAKAGNFSIDEMKEGIEYAHAHGVKIYVTVNIFAHNYDIDGLKNYFSEIKDIGIDAILVADPGIFALARECMPDMEIHISTQANNTNYMTYNFWHKMGATRVVTARELSLAEIKEIREKTDPSLEIEAFMHGAMCISYSGRCLLSSYFTGRDANHGACTHPCRWKYAIVEESRPGEYLPIEEDERGTYIFNSKDLCMIEHIPEMVDAGIYSFKVEGRMKTALYVAAVTRTYRQAIDDYLKDEELYRSRIPYYKEEIAACTFRQFTTGFYFGKPTHESQIYDSNTYIRNFTYIGLVEDVCEVNTDYIKDIKNVPDEVVSLAENIVASEDRLVQVKFYQKNKFCIGDSITAMLYADGTTKNVNLDMTVVAITDDENKYMESAPHPKQNLIVTLRVSKDAENVEKGMILRAVCDDGTADCG